MPLWPRRPPEPPSVGTLIVPMENESTSRRDPDRMGPTLAARNPEQMAELLATAGQSC